MSHIATTEPPSADALHDIKRNLPAPGGSRRRGRSALMLAAGVIAVGAGAVYWLTGPAGHTAAPAMPLPRVTVGTPLQESIAADTEFLGQFSAVETVELRAQVGGTLTSIGFSDGQIVHKGDPLFSIDPRPYQVRLAEANAQLQSTEARKVLTGLELARAAQLRRSDYASVETLDQRQADQHAAEAASAAAGAAVADARLDLEFSQVTAPFTGRIGAHQVSVGNLVSGSRAGTSPTTLLATLVSLDPIHLDFDMSEADYIAFQHSHPGNTRKAQILLSTGDSTRFDRQGVLDFLDNRLDRASGTMHARATVGNADFALTPGQFSRIRVPTGTMQRVLLVPPGAIVPDQSRETLMVVQPDGKVALRTVKTGGLRNGLRIVRDGLKPDDRVVIDGVMQAQPGAKVDIVQGKIVADSAADGS